MNLWTPHSGPGHPRMSLGMQLSPSHMQAGGLMWRCGRVLGLDLQSVRVWPRPHGKGYLLATLNSSSRPSGAHTAMAPWTWGCSSQPLPLAWGRVSSSWLLLCYSSIVLILLTLQCIHCPRPELWHSWRHSSFLSLLSGVTLFCLLSENHCILQSVLFSGCLG